MPETERNACGTCFGYVLDHRRVSNGNLVLALVLFRRTYY